MDDCKETDRSMKRKVLIIGRVVFVSIWLMLILAAAFVILAYAGYKQGRTLNIIFGVVWGVCLSMFLNIIKDEIRLCKIRLEHDND